MLILERHRKKISGGSIAVFGVALATSPGDAELWEELGVDFFAILSVWASTVKEQQDAHPEEALQ